MATAIKKVRPPAARARSAAGLAPSTFVVFESNGGEYRWELVTENGAPLAQSVSFASFDDAEQAAVCMRDGAASARLDPRPRSADGGVFARAPMVAAAATRKA